MDAQREKDREKKRALDATESAARGAAVGQAGNGESLTVETEDSSQPAFHPSKAARRERAKTVRIEQKAVKSEARAVVVQEESFPEEEAEVSMVVEGELSEEEAGATQERYEADEPKRGEVAYYCFLEGTAYLFVQAPALDGLKAAGFEEAFLPSGGVPPRLAALHPLTNRDLRTVEALVDAAQRVIRNARLLPCEPARDKVSARDRSMPFRTVAPEIGCVHPIAFRIHPRMRLGFKALTMARPGANVKHALLRSRSFDYNSWSDQPVNSAFGSCWAVCPGGEDRDLRELPQLPASVSEKLPRQMLPDRPYFISGAIELPSSASQETVFRRVGADVAGGQQGEDVAVRPHDFGDFSTGWAFTSATNIWMRDPPPLHQDPTVTQGAAPFCGVASAYTLLRSLKGWRAEEEETPFSACLNAALEGLQTLDPLAVTRFREEEPENHLRHLQYLLRRDPPAAWTVLLARMEGGAAADGEVGADPHDFTPTPDLLLRVAAMPFASLFAQSSRLWHDRLFMEGGTFADEVLFCFLALFFPSKAIAVHFVQGGMLTAHRYGAIPDPHTVVDLLIVQTRTFRFDEEERVVVLTDGRFGGVESALVHYNYRSLVPEDERQPRPERGEVVRAAPTEEGAGGAPHGPIARTGRRLSVTVLKENLRRVKALGSLRVTETSDGRASLALRCEASGVSDFAFSGGVVHGCDAQPLGQTADFVRVDRVYPNFDLLAAVLRCRLSRSVRDSRLTMMTNGEGGRKLCIRDGEHSDALEVDREGRVVGLTAGRTYLMYAAVLPRLEEVCLRYFGAFGGFALTGAAGGRPDGRPARYVDEAPCVWRGARQPDVRPHLRCSPWPSPPRRQWKIRVTFTRDPERATEPQVEGEAAQRPESFWSRDAPQERVSRALLRPEVAAHYVTQSHSPQLPVIFANSHSSILPVPPYSGSSRVALRYRTLVLDAAGLFHRDRRVDPNRRICGADAEELDRAVSYLMSADPAPRLSVDAARLELSFREHGAATEHLFHLGRIERSLEVSFRGLAPSEAEGAAWTGNREGITRASGSCLCSYHNQQLLFRRASGPPVPVEGCDGLEVHDIRFLDEEVYVCAAGALAPNRLHFYRGLRPMDVEILPGRGEVVRCPGSYAVGAAIAQLETHENLLVVGTDLLWDNYVRTYRYEVDEAVVRLIPHTGSRRVADRYRLSCTPRGIACCHEMEPRCSFRVRPQVLLDDVLMGAPIDLVQFGGRVLIEPRSIRESAARRAKIFESERTSSTSSPTATDGSATRALLETSGDQLLRDHYRVEVAMVFFDHNFWTLLEDGVAITAYPLQEGSSFYAGTGLLVPTPAQLRKMRPLPPKRPRKMLASTAARLGLESGTAPRDPTQTNAEHSQPVARWRERVGAMVTRGTTPTPQELMVCEVARVTHLWAFVFHKGVGTGPESGGAPSPPPRAAKRRLVRDGEVSSRGLGFSSNVGADIAMGHRFGPILARGLDEHSSDTDGSDGTLSNEDGYTSGTTYASDFEQSSS